MTPSRLEVLGFALFLLACAAVCAALLVNAVGGP